MSGRRCLPVLLAGALLLCLATSCAYWMNAGSGRSNVLRLAGSDTMAPLVQRWGAAFMAAHPGVVVESRGGGSGAGIDALIAGSVDLCTSSRPLVAAEVQRLRQAHGALGVSILTARDALSIYVHPLNPVQALALEQVRAIFDGAVTSWSDLGGAAWPIHVIHRQPNSGTHHFLRRHVLLEAPYGPATQVVANTAAVIQAVTAHRGAVGYGGLAYGAGTVVHCTIDGVDPTPANVRSGAYPLSRYLYLYARRTPTGVAGAFVDWVLSDAGQRIVAASGYVPLWAPGAVR